ncbi:MAG: hypothetical protein HQK57_10775, partial [Deltaproteobacteria bacterium]|nr:hypothetical protein [Deltaproteobacteria bacterium]
DLEAKGIADREVEVEGKVHVLSKKDKTELLKTMGLTGVQMTLYRFVLVCCAADSRPMAVVLEGVLPKHFVNDGWYRVRGTSSKITKKTLVKSPTLSISAKEIVPIPEPPGPYLSLW